ncbi:MAG: hypothetical protein U0169_27310 [Polyangiaceae bacterium]
MIGRGGRGRGSVAGALAITFAASLAGSMAWRAHTAARTKEARDAAKAHDVTDAPPAPVTYESAVKELGARRAQAEKMATLGERVGSRWAAAANVEMTYARLTGDYDAYARADSSLAEAFRLARTYVDDDGVGPLLLKAQLDYELHRLRPALAALDVPEKSATFFGDTAKLAEIAALRGAITFSLGEYDAGIALLRKAVSLGSNPSHSQRLALALDRVGETDEAMRLFEASERTIAEPRARAWIALQRGRMAFERGRRADARRHYETARALFPGFWQVDEHLAELDALEGHTERAVASYRSLVARTDDPEFMDALAELVKSSAPEEAARLAERSRELYEKRLRTLPEASYGHALEHFLRHERDGARALDIATKNVALRPDGEARTRLAQAYVRVGRLAEAKAEIRAVTSSRWQSAASWATSALVHRRLGDVAEAETSERRAVAMHPFAMAELDWL